MIIIWALLCSESHILQEAFTEESTLPLVPIIAEKLSQKDPP